MKKYLVIGFIIAAFVCSLVFFIPHDRIYRVKEVISPVNIVLDKTGLKLKNTDCFDSVYSEKNAVLAKNLGMTEEEAFIFGNLGKYWAENLLKGRLVYIKNDSDLVYLKYSYLEKFLYSGFCLKDSKPFYPEGFSKRLEEVRSTEYKVLDMDSEAVYNPDDAAVKNLKDFIVVKKIHLPRHVLKRKQEQENKTYTTKFDFGKVKLYFADSTSKLKPDRGCDSSICKELLKNINNSKQSIDMAIYGYSRTAKIEEALKAALKRGVKIRMVCDSDPKGGNIYPETDVITRLLPDNKSDINSDEVKNIMHNKFYIFDNKILITGSANLSHTDMSGFNSNSIVVIESPEAAKIYTEEFENMYSGKFHNSKPSKPNKKLNISGMEIEIFFSPQDKSITNAVLPVINGAKRYIYIPTFVLTDRKVTESLIKAKARGVDVRIIIDALNASVQHSKHNELRRGGILVKTENYAGKMHSKSIIVDDEYTIIGSMNFSYSGENKNDENLLVIKNPEIARSYKEFFLYQWGKIDDKWLKYNARAEGKDSIGSCTDGLDNNYDGLTDSNDPACLSR